MKNWILSHKKTVIIGVCVLAVILTISVILLHRKNTTPVSQIEGEQNLTTESQEINVWGEVKCTNAENINIDFPAFVTDVLIKEGDRVTLGDTGPYRI
jgi:biotin carboxyl carrier protein